MTETPPAVPRPLSGARHGDNPDIVLRRALPGDLEEIVAIYNDSVADGVSNCDLSAVTAETMASWLAEHSGRYPVFVALRGERVAGWASLSAFVSKACFDRTAYTSTYVARAVRGQGVGGTLRRHIISQAKALGFHVLLSRVFVRNSLSVAITERLGFEKVAHLGEVIFRDGEYWDAALYQLTFKEGE